MSKDLRIIPGEEPFTAAGRREVGRRAGGARSAAVKHLEQTATRRCVFVTHQTVLLRRVTWRPSKQGSSEKTKQGIMGGTSTVTNYDATPPAPSVRRDVSESNGVKDKQLIF